MTPTSLRLVRVGACVAGLAIVGITDQGWAQSNTDGQNREPVEFQWVGTTAHSWGAWVTPGAAVEDWVEQARDLCAGEGICEVNVFEGPEHATHEIPVPEANQVGLRWVLRYRHNETPRVVVEEVRGAPGQEPRTFVFER